MIVEMISFDCPPGATADDILDDARGTVDHWRSNPDLIRKHYVRCDDGRLAGIYVWPSRQAAEKAHDSAWVARFRKRTGQAPTIAYFETFLEIDNAAGTVREYPLA